MFWGKKRNQLYKPKDKNRLEEIVIKIIFYKSQELTLKYDSFSVVIIFSN